MEIAGIILEITSRLIRISTYEKKQEIDVYYTATNAEDVKALIKYEMVKFEIKLQSVEVGDEKLARCWLTFIISPTKRQVSKPEEEKQGWGQKRTNLK